VTRRLSLSRETLAELTAEELADVNGAQQLSGTCLTFLTCNPTCWTE
jgi:hypothetical protein